jgi:hypothetical protein
LAYNVLKGSVAGSVDQHADQEIDGVKVFKSTISASVFYDTDAESPCATMKDVAITEIKGAARNSILTYNGGTGVQANFSLIYEKNTLFTDKLQAKEIAGSGRRLVQLPADKFIEPIRAEYINHGPGLSDIRGTLQTNIGAGLVFDGDSITLSVSAAGGLNMLNGQLVIDPTRAENIITSGQALSEDDLLVVADVSKRKVNKVTLSQLYDNYIDAKVAKPAGNKNEIQFKNRRKFDSSSKLTYDDSKSLLKNEGAFRTLEAQIENSLVCLGAIHKSIKNVSSEAVYEVQPSDHTLLVDTYKCAVKIILPAAINNKGRVIVVKKTNTDKYNIRSTPVVIESAGDLIDQKEQIAIKMNYAVRELHSDGVSWWVTGATGT